MQPSTVSPDSTAFAHKPADEHVRNGGRVIMSELGSPPDPSPFSALPPFHSNDNDDIRPKSAASGRSKSRSSSSLDARISLPLERALSQMQRADGARETRTVLPGVDLRSAFGVDVEGCTGGLGDLEEKREGCPGLTVLQTPKGVDLREAVFEAQALGECGATRPSSAEDAFQAGDAASPRWARALGAGGSQPGVHGTSEMEIFASPNDKRMRPWEYLVRKLSRHQSEEARIQKQALEPFALSAAQTPPPKHAEQFVTPPAGPPLSISLPVEASISASTSLRWRLPRLKVDVDVEENAVEPSSAAAGMLSPGPPITPGAPTVVPVELRADAAARLWPMLAPFTPRMLRDDILSPPSQRRFVVRSSQAETAALKPMGRILEESTEPHAQPVKAAVAVADVSGFTALTEALSKEGPAGVELLTKCMNSYFAQMIDLVLHYGGDISKFAGDAMLIVFLPTPEEESAAADELHSDGGLRRATLRAAACVKELADKYGVMKMQPNGDVQAVSRDELVRENGRYILRTHSPLVDDDEHYHYPTRPASQATSLGPSPSTPRFIAHAAHLAPIGLVTPWRWRHHLHNRHGSHAHRRFNSGPAAEEAMYEESKDRLGDRPESEFNMSSRGLRGGLSRFGSRRVRSTGELLELEHVALQGNTVEEDIDGEAEVEEEDTQDELEHPHELRGVHERALESLAAEFTGGAKTVRPPELPLILRSSLNGSAHSGIHISTSARGFASSPALVNEDTGKHKEEANLNEKGLGTAASWPPTSPAGGMPRDVAAHQPAKCYAGGEVLDDQTLGLESPTILLAGFKEQSATSALDRQRQRHGNLMGLNKRTASTASSVGRGSDIGLHRGSRALARFFSSALGRHPAHDSSTGASDEASGRSLSTASSIMAQHRGPLAATLTSLAPRMQSSSSSRTAALVGLNSGGGRGGHSPPVSPSHLGRQRTGSGASHGGDRSPFSSVADHEVRHAFEHLGPKPGHEILSMKVTLAVGMLCAYRVGGVAELTLVGGRDAARWEFFVADMLGGGEEREMKESVTHNPVRGPIAQLTATECCALPGEAVLSAEALEMIGTDQIIIDELPDGAGRILSLNKGPRCMPSPWYASPTRRPTWEATRLQNLPPRERVAAYQTLRTHVPFNIRYRIEAGHIDFVNEVRVCTVIFFGFPSLGQESTACGPQAKHGVQPVQVVAATTQSRMHQDGGFFLQMRCDEKGYLALCAFGLPGRAHEDSPSRGVIAALAVIAALQRQGHVAVAGVTTGNLFCAVVGSQRRAEYTVFGDAINLAARLMTQAAQGKGAVLCDEATRWLAAGRAAFHALDPIRLKGKMAPMRAFHVTALDAWNPNATSGPMSPVFAPRALPLVGSMYRAPASNNDTVATELMANRAPASWRSSQSAVPLIGRDHEISSIASRLASLVDGRGGAAVFIEGEAGLGKTRLVEEVAWGEGLAPLRSRCVVLVGAGKAMRQSEPFFPWRKIYRQLFAVDRQRSADRQARLSEYQDEEHPVASAPTDLALRLRDRIPEYATWRATLASALGLDSADMLVPAVRQNRAGDATPPTPRSLRGFRTSPGVTALPIWDDMPRAHSIAVGVLGLPPAEDLVEDVNGELLPGNLVVTPPMVRSLSARNLDPGRLSVGGIRSTMASPPAEMSVSLRAEKVRGLFVSILREFVACHGPLLIVLDDTHLFDSPSWRLMLAVLEALPQAVLLLATLRPVLRLPSSDIPRSSSPSALTSLQTSGAPSPSPAVADSMAGLASDEVFSRRLGEYYQRALNMESTERIILHRFTLEEARKFVSAALDGAQVPLPTARLFWEKSAGLPAYLQQITLFFKLTSGSGLQTPQSGLELARMGMEFVRATVNVHSIVPARVDRLGPDEQLTLKVASIMGTTIYADLLLAIHPRHPSPRRLEAQLKALSNEAGFLSVDRNAAPGTWRFTDVLARDVVYDMIPVTQRRQWHARLARAMEGVGDSEMAKGRRRRSIPAAIIAYHWAQACIYQEVTEWRWALKAIAWWENAAAEASLSWAYHEEVTLLQHARALGDELASVAGTPGCPRGLEPPPAWRRARWERCSAAALLNATECEEGELTAAAVHCLRALGLLGVPLPWSQEYRNSGPGLTSSITNFVHSLASIWCRPFFLCGVDLGKGGSDKTFEDDVTMASTLAALARLTPVSVCSIMKNAHVEDVSTLKDGGPPDERGENAACTAERERKAAVSVLSIALLRSASLDRESARYAIWAINYVTGRRPDRGSKLDKVQRRLVNALVVVRQGGARI